MRGVVKKDGRGGDGCQIGTPTKNIKFRFMFSCQDSSSVQDVGSNFLF